MNLTQSSIGTSDILAVEGRVDATTSKDLEAAVLGLAANGSGSVVLDFSGVEYISSAGLRVLLIGLKTLTAKQRRLALASLNSDVMDVVRLTGFDKLLNCYDDVDAALNAIGD